MATHRCRGWTQEEGANLIWPSAQTSPSQCNKERKATSSWKAFLLEMKIKSHCEDIEVGICKRKYFSHLTINGLGTKSPWEITKSALLRSLGPRLRKTSSKDYLTYWKLKKVFFYIFSWWTLSFFRFCIESGFDTLLTKPFPITEE